MRKRIALIGTIILVALTALLLNQLQIGVLNGEDDVERYSNTSEADVKSQPLNFQGEMNDTKVTDEGLTLDTSTVLTENKVAEGSRVVGASDGKVYFSRNGRTFYLEDGEETRLDFDSTYGAVTGNFDYPGFNVIYGNSDSEVMIRNLDTGEEEKLVETGVVEVTRTDSNDNGVQEAAQLRLMNGSTITYTPEKQMGRTDWDEDGYEERIYLKNGKLQNYDSKHGEEQLTEANSFAPGQNDLYVSNGDEVIRLEFDQEPVESGSYISNERGFEEEVTLKQLISDVELNGGTVSITVVTPEAEQTFEVSEGLSDQELDIETDRFNTSIRIEKGSGEAPVINSYEILYR